MAREEQDADGPILMLYSWAERLISAIILAGMCVVIALSTWSFLRTVVAVAFDSESALDYAQFQTLFDRVLAAVIAIELAHSIRQMVAGKHGLDQLRTVVVIGMLAVIRKLITVEVQSTTGVFLMGVASAVIALAFVLLAIHRVEDFRMRQGREADGPPGGSGRG